MCEGFLKDIQKSRKVIPGDLEYRLASDAPYSTSNQLRQYRHPLRPNAYPKTEETDTHRQKVSARRRAYGPGCESRKMSCPRRYFCSIKWRLSRLKGFDTSRSASSVWGKRLGCEAARISCEMSPSFRTPIGCGCCFSSLRMCFSLRSAMVCTICCLREKTSKSAGKWGYRGKERTVSSDCLRRECPSEKNLQPGAGRETRGATSWPSWRRKGIQPSSHGWWRWTDCQANAGANLMADPAPASHRTRRPPGGPLEAG